MSWRTGEGYPDKDECRILYPCTRGLGMTVTVWALLAPCTYRTGVREGNVFGREGRRVEWKYKVKRDNSNE
ncbi:hypothetical protein E2C01_061456 [Portunus trituberculatus]|uniref:Uncharacterized protein n=1 Tax=Portunus trituberculatus TaxID=210409 RepID=A0A5B7HB00_PORTR|nr:hypothetical protein [Portunus trituberculatus]